MEKLEILSHQSFFREINYLVTSLVNSTLISRIFSKKSVKKREIHTHQTIFREINYLVTSLVKS